MVLFYRGWYLKWMMLVSTRTWKVEWAALLPISAPAGVGEGNWLELCPAKCLKSRPGVPALLVGCQRRIRLAARAYREASRQGSGLPAGVAGRGPVSPPPVYTTCAPVTGLVGRDTSLTGLLGRDPSARVSSPRVHYLHAERER